MHIYPYSIDRTKRVKELILEWGYYEDLLELDDYRKDKLCEALLLDNPEYMEELIPAIIDKKSEWIEMLYGYYVASDLIDEYRESVYLNIEGVLEDVVSWVQADLRREASIYE
jgi:hypothetical protein